MSATTAALILYPHLRVWLAAQTKRAKCLILRQARKIGSLIWSARYPRDRGRV